MVNPPMSIQSSDRIFIAGHRGMVGSALVRALESKSFANLITRDRRQLDLCDSNAVTEFFAKEKPDVVIFAAAKVGGIKANNDQPVEFQIGRASCRERV